MRATPVLLVLLAAVGLAPTAHAAKKPTAADEAAKLRAEVDTLKAEVAYLREKLAVLERTLAPVLAEAEAKARQDALRPRFEERSAGDAKVYTAEQIEEAERLYSSDKTTGKGWGTAEFKKNLAKVIKNYPKSNRAGCALLYLAQMADPDDREKHLDQAIREYGDCFYGDGVQVGAYARYLLARDCLERGDKAGADRLFAEIRSQFPGAIDHDGNYLVTDEP